MNNLDPLSILMLVLSSALFLIVGWAFGWAGLSGGILLSIFCVAMTIREQEDKRA